MRRLALLLSAGLGLIGCSDPEQSPTINPTATPAGAGAGPAADGAPPGDDDEQPAGDPADQPLVGLSPEARALFDRGDKLFDRVFAVADGLGPLYIRSACSACHQKAGAGPGDVQKFQVVDPITLAPIKDALELAYGGTERPFAVAGGTRPLLAPAARPGHLLVHSRRSGPTVMGRGYLEAVLDSEIERVAAEQAARADGIHGRINRVTYHSQSVPGVPIS